jgi:hypothetical protein
MTRRCLPAIAAALLSLSCLAAPAEGQYFGRNKVQYRAFDFQVIRTQNFDVYYYPQEREAAIDAARMVERAYARLSRILQHEFEERKPLIVYASHADFQQTNALPFMLDEGTGGVTESYKSRMILPFTGSYADFDHVLTHELVHAFQYDVIFRRGIVSDAAPFNARLPLWFMEGMAEYLSIGRIDPHTVSWLRDAVLQGYLRSIAEMSQRDDYLSYRFGQSLWAFIAAKWGDEVVGILLQKAPRMGVERAFVTTLNMTLDELNREWQTAVRAEYLAQVTEYDQPEAFATRITERRQLYDPWFLAPAISPDGRDVVYLSQRDGFSFDLYLADTRTGKVRRRLVQSARDANVESLRYMNSAAAFSPDGRYLAFAAKAGGRDVLNIYDLQRSRVVRRLRFDLNGILSPSWSPDGRRIVFSGLDGGLSDLFIADMDGGLERLTSDRYAALLPAWSPDGRTIAFTTDRAGTDLDLLLYGNMRVALIDVATRAIDVLPMQDEGKNINPAWSPDGRSLVWVSDRSRTNDLYLFDLDTRELSRITHMLSGAIAVTPLSPVLSWSRSGPLVFTHFESAGYGTYLVEDPLALPRTPVRPEPALAAAAEPAPAAEAVSMPAAQDHAEPVPAAPPASESSRAAAPPAPPPQAPARPTAVPVARAEPTAADGAEGVAAAADTSRAAGLVASWYRDTDGVFRLSAAAPAGGEVPAPVSVIALLDSAALALPDTAEFDFRGYRARLSADAIGRPSVGAEVGGGYYGNGLYGGTYVTFSDMLGNHNLLVAGSINGALSDASVYTGYAFLKRRANYSVSLWQVPLYRYMGGGYLPIVVKGEERIAAANVFQRDVIRGLELGISYPLSTFRRIELNAIGVSYNSQVLFRGYDAVTYEPLEIDQRIDGFRYVQPRIATVFDNSVFGWTGPVYGRRYRAQLSRTFGDLQFNEALLDFRNYVNWKRRVVLATRVIGLTRFGGEAERFGLFWGGPYYVRGYDYTSFDVNGAECRDSRAYGDGVSWSRCPVRDQLVGASAAFVNSEVRFPIITELQLGALGNFPPVDAVAFFDGGVAWDSRVCRVPDYARADNCVPGESLPVRLTWDRKPGEDPFLVREPLFSYGVGLRMNVFYTVLRLDYARPASRPGRSGILSFSLGPSF